MGISIQDIFILNVTLHGGVRFFAFPPMPMNGFLICCVISIYRKTFIVTAHSLDEMRGDKKKRTRSVHRHWSEATT